MVGHEYLEIGYRIWGSIHHTQNKEKDLIEKHTCIIPA